MGLALISGALAFATTSAPDAEAVSAFDDALIALVNDHRAGMSLAPLIEYPDLSAAALDWSDTMAAASTFPCGVEGFGNDTNANIATQGVPPDTYAASENVGISCGVSGVLISTTDTGLPTGNPLFTYPGQPLICDAPTMDWTTPEFRFCSWMQSQTHRADMENPSFTHVGSGTVQQSMGISTGTYVTQRYAAVGCGGEPITVFIGAGDMPTIGDDVILGTNLADKIKGLAGNDLICSLEGDDIVRAGPGDDRVWAGDDDDIVFGGGGADSLFGELGADTLRGQGGTDTILGGDGNDRLEGGGAPDTLHGQGGDDDINGSNGADMMFGGDGADTIRGVLGPDTIEGGDGDDDLFGGNGNDDLRGDTGTDKCAGNLGGGDRAHASTCETRPGIEVLY